MALTKEQEDQFDKALHDAMRKQFYSGMSVGAQASCKIVLDLLNDSAYPLIKRIVHVKNYCKKSLKNGKLSIEEDQKPTEERHTDGNDEE